VVVLGSVAGDRHSLPTAIMSDLLRGAGLEVVDLGADCPAESFADAVERADGPCAVGICVTAPEAVDGVPQVISDLRGLGVDTPVVLGGGAIADAASAARLGADHWAGPVDEVIALFLQLASGTPGGGAE
jgi:methanogenic corrinoid protein MtbC1